MKALGSFLFVQFAALVAVADLALLTAVFVRVFRFLVGL